MTRLDHGEEMMPPSSHFQRTWFAWRRLTPPVERFRSGQRNAPTYDFECALDHLDSSVNGIGSGFLAGKATWDYEALIPPRLAEVTRLQNMLDSMEIPDERKRTYTDFLSATRAVLAVLSEAVHSERNT